MKFGELESIGHNIADSLASGIGLLIGVYEMDVFGEAARSATGVIEADFLSGEISEGEASEDLAAAVRAYAKALPALCERHGVDAKAFRVLAARFTMLGGRRFVVRVADQNGKASERTYVGLPGRRPVVKDTLGRIRRVKRLTSRK